MSVIDFSDKLLRAITLPQANLAYNKTEANGGQSGSRNALKVTLGIIPDVTGGDNTGLIIMGVNPNGVAHKAELLKGDKIVNIDGTPIKNVYDYMEKLQQIKKQQVSHITVVREGEEKVFLLQF
jgi:S1-C subfamily serine protease